MLPLTLSLALLSTSPAAHAATVGPDPTAQTACPVDAASPGADWPVAAQAPPAAAPPSQALAELERYLFPADLDWADKDKRGVRTDGVVIVHRGQIVYERYAHGYDATRPHLAWSVSKTFTSSLVGIAVQQGRLSLDASVCTVLADVPQHACVITVADLLAFSSGLDWKETYEHDPPTSSSVLAMLYGEGQSDMARFVLGHPLRDRPGESFQYSSGDSNVLSAIAGAALAPAHGERFPWTALFEPLQMQGVTFERDGAGTYVGSSYLYATPRDMARLGQLWLDDGCWGGQRLLPPGWVAWSTQVTPGMKAKPLEWTVGDAVQGRQVWLNQPLPEQGAPDLPWPAAPPDTFAAMGHWKQSITVIPSRDLVIVRTGDDRDGAWSHNVFLDRALHLVEGL